MQQLKWHCYNLCMQVTQVAVPTTVHCDHQAKVDAVTDLARAKHKVMRF
jgi:hypothetical protein